MDDVVSSIERATLDAVPPAARQEVGPWLVGLDGGPVGRAHSAAPLSHAPTAADPAYRDAIEACFATHGHPVVYRLPQVAAFDSIRRRLDADGFVVARPAAVHHGHVQDLLESPASRTGVPATIHVATQPDAGWGEVFLGDGFDPVEGRVRLGMLRRAKDAVFASALLDGHVVAVGASCFSQGWCGIHGMRTPPGHRNRGFARAILMALTQQARLRGLKRVFLQVETGNAPALALYRSMGFVQAWTYDYWRHPG